MKSVSLRSKLIISISTLIFIAVCIVSLISYFSVSSAYKRTIQVTQSKLDQMIQSQVECIIGVLQANYDRYTNGEITEKEAQDTAAYIVRSTRYNNGVGYFWADMADGTSAVHIKPEVEGTNRFNTQDEKGNYFVQDTINAGNKPDGGFIDFYFTKPNESEAKAKRGYVKKFEPYGWYIGTGNYQEDMLPLIQTELDSLNKVRFVTIIILCSSGAFVIALGILVMSIIAKKISKPIENVSDRLQKLSQGNLYDNVNVVNTYNEVGILTNSLSKTIEVLRKYIENISQVMTEFDRGNMDIEIDFDYIGDFEAIKNSILSTVKTFNETFVQINMGAMQVSAGSSQISTISQMLAQGTTEQSGSVEALVATIDEISEHVEQNAENAHKASIKAKDTTTELENGKQQMKRMISAMEKINETSMEIVKIIKTSEDIAFQTNILALNAAVEAARAGSTGKEFSVIADEISNLANKSAKASKTTAELIENSVKNIHEGMEIADMTADSFNKIVVSSQESAELVHQISNASQEQASSIIKIKQEVEQISNVVQTNSATAEESAASSEELSNQAEILKNLVEQFKLKDSNIVK